MKTVSLGSRVGLRGQLEVWGLVRCEIRVISLSCCPSVTKTCFSFWISGVPNIWSNSCVLPHRLSYRLLHIVWCHDTHWYVQGTCINCWQEYLTIFTDTQSSMNFLNLYWNMNGKPTLCIYLTENRLKWVHPCLRWMIFQTVHGNNLHVHYATVHII